jgi:uncharacterized protein YidB (DUF937 family)
MFSAPVGDDVYYAQNQIVKSLPKLVDKATNQGALHLGTGRMGPSSASS